MQKQLTVENLLTVIFDYNRSRFKNLQDVVSQHSKMDERFEYDGLYGIVYYEKTPVPAYNILESMGYVPDSKTAKPIVLLSKDKILEVMKNELAAHKTLDFKFSPTTYTGQLVGEIIQKTGHASFDDMFTTIFGTFPPTPKAQQTPSKK